MMWFRFALIAMFSMTAASLFFYQGVEIFHAFVDFYKQK